MRRIVSILGRLFTRKPYRARRQRLIRMERLEQRNVFAGIAGGDFNGDGRDDFAVGVPFEDIGEIEDAGAINVGYGTISGISTAGNQFIHQNTSGLLEAVEASDGFGWELASGDFNGDGKDDLAIGVPFESVGNVIASGAVQILYGTAGGLSSAGNQLWSQNSSGIADSSEPGDSFGIALVAGDFNGDGKDDLAIGAPGESVGTASRAGTVHILLGTVSGLTSTGSQIWNQNSSGIDDVAESDDAFGIELAAGDFNGDGKADLVIGVPTENIGSISDAGAFHVLLGAATGLTATGSRFISQNTGSILEVAESGDLFGNALAAADFNGDGKDDLAVGSPGENLGASNEISDAGAVQVLFGAAAGLVDAGNQFWTQNSSGILEISEPFDKFGYDLTAGDFNGDGRSDLTIGAPGETQGVSPNLIFGGGVSVLYGTGAGLAATGNQIWNQNSTGILDVAEDGDLFGYFVAQGDFNGDGRFDLLVVSPAEDIGAAESAGAVNTIYGTASGLGSSNNQLWHQNISGVLDACEDFDGWPV